MEKIEKEQQKLYGPLTRTLVKDILHTKSLDQKIMLSRAAILSRKIRPQPLYYNMERDYGSHGKYYKQYGESIAKGTGQVRQYSFITHSGSQTQYRSGYLKQTENVSVQIQTQLQQNNCTQFQQNQQNNINNTTKLQQFSQIIQIQEDSKQQQSKLNCSIILVQSEQQNSQNISQNDNSFLNKQQQQTRTSDSIQYSTQLCQSQIISQVGFRKKKSNVVSFQLDLQNKSKQQQQMKEKQNEEIEGLKKQVKQLKQQINVIDQQKNKWKKKSLKYLGKIKAIEAEQQRFQNAFTKNQKKQ